MRLAAIALAFALSLTGTACAKEGVAIPGPAINSSNTTAPEKVVLAGGCFWGVQAVFQHVKGVTRAVSGYAGGSRADASYEIVSGGNTGHAESVEVTFDPKVISFGRILQIYFSVAHDPTELNYQGPDHGTQYRSNIFYTTPEQKRVAEAYIAQLAKAGTFGKPPVTRVSELRGFYPAEGYHQDYLTRHPDQAYIEIYDMPKLENLKRLYPMFWHEQPVLVKAS